VQGQCRGVDVRGALHLQAAACPATIECDFTSSALPQPRPHVRSRSRGGPPCSWGDKNVSQE